MLTATIGAFHVAHKTPFSEPARADASGAYDLAVQARRNKELPYVLDVWHGRRKVMSLSWNGAGRIKLAEYRVGPWEDEFLAL